MSKSVSSSDSASDCSTISTSGSTCLMTRRIASIGLSVSSTRIEAAKLSSTARTPPSCLRFSSISAAQFGQSKSFKRYFFTFTLSFWDTIPIWDSSCCPLLNGKHDLHQSFAKSGSMKLWISTKTRQLATPHLSPSVLSPYPPSPAFQSSCFTYFVKMNLFGSIEWTLSDHYP